MLARRLMRGVLPFRLWGFGRLGRLLLRGTFEDFWRFLWPLGGCWFLGGGQVTSAQQFDQLVKALDRSRAAVLLVQRGEAAQFVPIRPEKG